MKKKKKDKNPNTYRTFQIHISPTHPMFSYCKEMCQFAKNMYNTTNFYIRQIYTSLKSEKSLQPLQQEVMDQLRMHLPLVNENQHKAYEKKLLMESKKPAEEQKEVKLNLMEMPKKEKSFPSYNLLDALFKSMKQADYKLLPAQSSQGVMKAVYQDWSSFFASIEEYAINPSKFSGRPKIPKYRKTMVKEVYFTNQDCKIQNGMYLKFPKTKQRLCIGKVAEFDGKLQQVRVIPSYNQFTVEMVYKQNNIVEIPEKPKYERMMSIDLGVNNLATIVMNTGRRPVIVKGKTVKSINQYYNKKRAYLYGILRQGKEKREGLFTSKKLEHLDRKRFLKIKDMFHKISYNIVQLAVQEGIDTIIVGKNDGWKQEVEMRKDAKQNFVQLPHNLFIQQITYKANTKGIHVVTVEESYTSKASFLDFDDIPTYGQTEIEQVFTVKRVKRGLYRSAEGTYLNADVNGARNILRKVVPNAFEPFKSNGIEGAVSHPRVLSVR
ncbi:transposase [Bacillus pseudomycoides]|uniref:RNA-guided endonuclease InsQ/TnpB family protein n=1 Tax=Bacillus pseudomycoides TaxID=64104 RepID=UPI001FB37DA5|nr:transposase [Bacillus pseudomycoides]